jgi:hypothetical protein
MRFRVDKGPNDAVVVTFANQRKATTGRGEHVKRALLVAAGLVSAAVMFTGGPAGAAGSHAAITITTNKDFTTCGCVTAGNGTASSPYVIGPWSIASPSSGTSGWSVKIDNSKGVITAFFNIFGISSTYNDTNTSDPTIWLVNVHTPTTISGTSANPTGGNDLGIGVEIDSSANIAINGVSYNKGNGTGVLINNSTNVSVDNSKLKATCTFCSPHVGDGIYAANSSNVEIGTSPSCPKSTPCNDLTYDDGFGAYLLNTHDSVIKGASADANDTGGYVLDGTNTYNVLLENSTSNGTGPICFTVNGVKANSGYLTDLQGGLHVINGAHGNTITNDTFTGNTGLSIASGGNGFYHNVCAGADQPFKAEAGMGSNNTFSGLCFSSTNITGLVSNCKS